MTTLISISLLDAIAGSNVHRFRDVVKSLRFSQARTREGTVAFDENLAERVRDAMGVEPGLTERKMFGGIAFMLEGHMFCGIVGDDLMLRLGAEGADAALERPHVRPMDFTGRPMTGMVFVAPEGLRGAALGRWIDQATAFVRTLPRKSAQQRSARQRRTRI
jgi:hypothetical protein